MILLQMPMDSKLNGNAGFALPFEPSVPVRRAPTYSSWLLSGIVQRHPSLIATACPSGHDIPLWERSNPDHQKGHRDKETLVLLMCMLYEKKAALIPLILAMKN